MEDSPNYLYDFPMEYGDHLLPVRDLLGDEFWMKTGYGTRRPKGSQDWLLIFTVEGQGHITSQRENSSLPPGHALLYDPTAEQDYWTAPDPGHWHLLWAHFQPYPHWLPFLDWPRQANGLRLLNARENQAEIIAALRRTSYHCQSRQPMAIEWAMHALEEALLLLNESQRQDPQSQWDPRIRQAVSEISHRLRQPPSLPELASRSGLSISRFSQLFTESVGLPPLRYAEQLRLRHARELLRLGSLRVSEVAEACGYESAFYFSNRYRKTFGYPPSREKSRP